jgi:hypothetical protein
MVEHLQRIFSRLKQIVPTSTSGSVRSEFSGQPCSVVPQVGSGGGLRPANYPVLQ